jgi:hypothetical protein
MKLQEVTKNEKEKNSILLFLSTILHKKDCSS